MIECCLPCPITQWVYSDSESSVASVNVTESSITVPAFDTLPAITGWLNVTGIICCVLLLLSYFILPVEKTSRHYLSVGLVVSLCLIQVSRSDAILDASC